MRKPLSIAVGLAVAGMAMCVTSNVVADETWQYVETDVVVDLFASKDFMDAGDVTFSAACDDTVKTCEFPPLNLDPNDDCGVADVSDPGTYVADGAYLYFQIETDDGWQFVEWHADFESTFTLMPMTKKGNPQVGNFEYSWEADFITEYMDDTDDVMNGLFANDMDIAVHAVVYMPDGCDEALEPGEASCDGDPLTTDDICFEDMDGNFYETALEACGYNFTMTGETAWAEGLDFVDSKRSWATYVNNLGEEELCVWTCTDGCDED